MNKRQKKKLIKAYLKKIERLRFTIQEQMLKLGERKVFVLNPNPLSSSIGGILKFEHPDSPST
jgi:hypothetical protein